MPRRLPATFSVLLYYTFCVGLLALPIFGATEPSYAPQPFACEIRYYFRQELPDAEPGQKNVSAPSFERERLPVSRVLMSKNLTTRIVDGRVPHLPYRFSIKMVSGHNGEPGTLDVNVLNTSGESVAGFPQVMQNPLSKTGETRRKEFDIPISQALKENIENSLLVHDQFITHIDLIIGVDEDFLSGDVPN